MFYRTTDSPGNENNTAYMGTTMAQASAHIEPEKKWKNIYCSFTIPANIVYLNLSFAVRTTGVTGTFSNIAIYEGELTERP